jgi:hypothetical protein
LPELERLYTGIPSNLRWEAVNYVWGRNDIPIRDRMQFLVNVMTKEISLKAVEYAGRRFAQQSKDGFMPLETEKHLNWWRLHEGSVR